MTDGVLIPARDDKSLFSAWRMSFYGAISLLILLPIISPEPYKDIIMFVPDGIIKTFQVTVLSIFFALIIGLFIGLGRMSRYAIINISCTIYVEVIRGIPLLVQLFYIYYALAKFVKIHDISSCYCNVHLLRSLYQRNLQSRYPVYSQRTDGSGTCSRSDKKSGHL